MKNEPQAFAPDPGGDPGTAMHAAALAVSGAGGDAIFDDLVRLLCGILAVDVAMISIYSDGDRARLRTLSTHMDGRTLRTFDYELAGTPCAAMLGRVFRYMRSGAAPECAPGSLFREKGMDSYAAHSLFAPDGRQLGLIAIMDRDPLPDQALVETTLKIFAVRVVAELERKIAEQKLRESEERYRAIFNASADALILWDSKLRRVDINPAFERMYGFTREEIVSGESDRGLPPEFAERRRQLVRRTLAGERCQVELETMRKSGERFYVEVRTIPVSYRGEPHVLAIARDITERQRANEVLRESEEQYRAIFNASEDSMVLWDSQLRRVDVNPAYERLYGYTRDEVLAPGYGSALPREHAERRLELIRRSLAGERGQAEVEAIRKNGERFQIELRTVPVRYRGEPHVLAIGRDISARKHAEEVLRASEEQYRAIFDATADAIVLRDAAGRVVDVNPALLAMSGYAREEVIGDESWMFVPPEMVKVARQMHRRVLAGETVDVEVAAVGKDGSRRDMEVRGVPMRYRGEPHVLAMARDITARKRAAEQRLALERQLRQAQKMESLGHLTGGIAHDFNNLLAGIMGYVALASERAAPGDPKLAGYLDEALLGCRRARDLVQQMLTFSRGQRGSLRPLALADAVAESLKLVRSSLPSTLEIRTDFDAGAPQVMLDPVQLDQVLLNLAINARDAMEGAGRLAFSVAQARGLQAECASCRKSFSGHFAELAVEDSGPGIAPEVLERMFEPFFTTKEVGRGSGMGLATVHGIVHEHGGHVVVEPGRRVGSRFRVLLPVPEAPGLPAAAAGPAAHPRRQRRMLEGHVLLVDDEASVAQPMRELLQSWGVSSTVTTSSLRAAELFAADPEAFDLVLTDQTMPGRTGVALARELLARRPGLPVILYTGHMDRATERDAKSAGIRAVLQKPVEPELLYGLLEEHLH